MLISASLLVWLVVPAAGLADWNRGARIEVAAADPDRHFVVLEFGSGYAAPHGSARVRVLQRRLAGAGFSPGPVDGRYGPLTEQAVRGFQAATGLVIDGIAGPVTLATIIRSRRTLYPGAGDSEPSSQRVRVLQRGLVGAGVNPGPIDGRYGPHTEHAVRRFQAKHGLEANGIAAAVTLQRLHTPRTVSLRARRPSGRRLGTGRRAPRGARRVGVSQPATRPQTTHQHAVPSSPRAAPAALVLVLLALLLGLVTTWFAYRKRRRRWTATQPRPPGRSTPSWVAASKTSHPATNPTDQPEVPNHNSPSTNPAGLAAAPRRPDDPEDWFRHAQNLQQQGHATAAAAAYHRADKLGHGGAAANLGVLHEQAGDHAAAQRCYRRADQRGDPNGAFDLAVALEEQHQLTAAAAAYQRADQRGHPKAAANLGVLLEAQGDLTAAENYYRKADQRGDPNGTFNLAVILQEAGDPTGALHAYQRASQLGDPQVAEMARAAAHQLHTQPKPADATTTQTTNHTNP